VVLLPITGPPPAGLEDGSGRWIDGDHDGTAGGDAVAILSRGGAAIQAIASEATGGQDAGLMAILDANFDEDALSGLTTARRARRL
jgi:hypothetical protein